MSIAFVGAVREVSCAYGRLQAADICFPRDVAAREAFYGGKLPGHGAVQK